MASDALVLRRFAELEAQGNAIARYPGNGHYYEATAWHKWATSAQHILRATFGESSPHHGNFGAAYAKAEKGEGGVQEVNALKGIFGAAKADYEGGYTFSMQALISGEVYGDFVALAKGALEEGAKDVAAVLACAALEDALKRYALLNSLDVANRTMQDVVNALKAKGLVGGAQKTLLDTMPRIRDYAMHANWDKITPQDVGSVLGFVEQLLLAKFS